MDALDLSEIFEPNDEIDDALSVLSGFLLDAILVPIVDIESLSFPNSVLGSTFA